MDKYDSLLIGLPQREILVNTYRLEYGRGVPLGQIGTGVAISARGPIWLSSANMIKRHTSIILYITFLLHPRNACLNANLILIYVLTIELTNMTAY